MEKISDLSDPYLNATETTSASGSDMLGEGLSQNVHRYMKKYFRMLQGTLPVQGLYQLVIREVEKPLLLETLKFRSYNQSKASEVLGINRNTLRKKLAQLDQDTL